MLQLLAPTLGIPNLICISWHLVDILGHFPDRWSVFALLLLFQVMYQSATASIMLCNKPLQKSNGLKQQAVISHSQICRLTATWPGQGGLQALGSGPWIPGSTLQAGCRSVPHVFYLPWISDYPGNVLFISREEA